MKIKSVIHGIEIMALQKVRIWISVHGSIPHHERKTGKQGTLSGVYPEVSKGERKFWRSHRIQSLAIYEDRGIGENF
jgi:hypothetical protein